MAKLWIWNAASTAWKKVSETNPLPTIWQDAEGNEAPIGTQTDPMYTNTTDKISERKISGDVDPTVVFANSDAANTQKTVTITKPDNVSQMHMISVHNPSTVTDLTVKVFTVAEELGGDDRDVLVNTLVIPQSQSVTGTTINSQGEMVYGWMNGGNGKLVISNNTVLGGSDGFTATVRVNEI